jgi:hypothetical protein
MRSLVWFLGAPSGKKFTSHLTDWWDRSWHMCPTLTCDAGHNLYVLTRILTIEHHLWNSPNYDKMKLSWEQKLTHDNFSFQFVTIDDVIVAQETLWIFRFVVVINHQCIWWAINHQSIRWSTCDIEETTPKRAATRFVVAINHQCIWWLISDREETTPKRAAVTPKTFKFKENL